MITQRLQSVGNFSGALVEGAPDSVAQAVPVGSQIIITANRLDPLSLGDAATIAQAMYTAFITSKPTPSSFEGYDLGWFLGTPDGFGDLLDVAINPTNAAWNLAQWWSALKPSSVNTGTIRVGGASFVGPTGGYRFVTRREALTDVCSQLAAEWRINPNGTLDADSPSVLFPSGAAPRVVITRKDEGLDGEFMGLQGSVLLVSTDIEGYATSVIVVAQGSGTSVVTGAANSGATTYKDFFGNNIILERFVDAPSDTSTTAGAKAAAELAKSSSVRRTLQVRSKTFAVLQYAKPGDSVYAYDMPAGLVDTNQISYRGEMALAAKLRVFGLTWPVERGMGVYCRKWVGGIATYVDLSDSWEYEQGETTWDVGAVPMELSALTLAGPTGLVTASGAATLGVNPQLQERSAARIGLLAIHSTTANFGTTAPHTTLQDTGASVTINEVAGRRYKFTVTANPISSNVGGVTTFYYSLVRNGVQVRVYQVPAEALSVPGYSLGLTFTHVETISTAAAGVVWKLQIAAILNQQVFDWGSGTLIRQFLVEDIGGV